MVPVVGYTTWWPLCLDIEPVALAEDERSKHIKKRSHREDNVNSVYVPIEESPFDKNLARSWSLLLNVPQSEYVEE
jgi:hypothetical protein